MPKTNIPSEGVRTDDLIREVFREASEDKHNVGDSKLTQLLGEINNGSCCNSDQAHWLKYRLQQLINTRKRIKADKLELELLVLINSIRFECCDCLAERCIYRDPNYPLEDVQAIMEEFRKRRAGEPNKLIDRIATEKK